MTQKKKNKKYNDQAFCSSRQKSLTVSCFQDPAF